jgi:hypothetical protein
MMAPPMQAPARMPAVPVVVSQARRFGCVFVLAIPMLALGVFAMVNALFIGPDTTKRCDLYFTDEAWCTEVLGKTGTATFSWTVRNAGHYNVTVQKSGRAVRQLSVGTLKPATSSAGGDATVTADLAPGDYKVTVTDAGSAGKQVILALEKDHGGLPMAPGTLAIVALMLLAPFALLGGAWAILMSEKAKIPSLFDVNGVTMRNGKVFPWSELQAARPHERIQRGSSRTTEIGLELIFRTGRALLTYRAIANLSQVKTVCEALKMGINPWA